MMHMMDNPVAAILLLVGLIVVLAALTIGLRLIATRERRPVPDSPVERERPSLEQ